jgi:hypothetical protein
MTIEPNPYEAPRAPLGRDAGRVPRSAYPWWVRLSMLGVPGRGGLWAFVAISLICAAGSVAYGFWDRRFFLGAAFLFSALMYWLSIRWVDRHGSWAPDA